MYSLRALCQDSAAAVCRVCEVRRALVRRRGWRCGPPGQHSERQRTDSVQSFEEALGLIEGWDFARQPDRSINNQRGRDHHPKVRKAHHIGHFFNFIFEAEFVGGLFGDFREGIAFRAAGSKDLQFFHGLVWFEGVGF
jgi:hypothetical protein